MLLLAALTPELTQKLSERQYLSMSMSEWGRIAEHYNVTTFFMQVTLAIIILIIALTAAGWVSRIVKSSLARVKFDPTLTKFVAKLVWWSILCMATLTSLGYFGIETTSFAAVIGAAGLAIGLGFQGTLSNLAAGTMLLVFRPYKVGDSVVIAGQSGVVDEIELFTTTIDTGDNRRIIIPNNSIFGSVIENTTFHTHRRADVLVGVSYAADIDGTRQVLTEAVNSVRGALREPAPAVTLLSLGECAVNWQVQIWAPTADLGAVKQELIRNVKRSLDDVGIEIPFPQMDLNLRSLPREMASEQQQRKAA